MKYPKQCDRLAAFYAAYELARFGRRTYGTGSGRAREAVGYSTTQADQWGREAGLLPVPGAGADPAVIAEWELRLEAAVSWSRSAGGAA